MTNPTRSEMLDSITHKIARTGGGTGPGETGYYLPIEKEDYYNYRNSRLKNFPIKLYFDGKIEVLWKTKGEPLSAQDDACITYIFNLISHD